MTGGRIFRYGLAIVGPVGSAGAQFLLQLVLLRMLDADAFGRFSFLLIASQFSWGVWSALFCAPLPILMLREETRARTLNAIFAISLFGTLVVGALFAIAGLLLGETMVPVALFAAYAAVALVRWLARAHAYAVGTQWRTTASDLFYALTILAGTTAMAAGLSASMTSAAALLLLASVAGLFPFGAVWASRQFRVPRSGDLPAYIGVWREHSGWSLLGVLTTEATANAHAYLVTLLRGPGAFAPLAASALLIRPITVAMNALTEFERAQMARMIGAGEEAAVAQAVRFFRMVMIAAWVATALAALALFLFAPRLIFPARYGLDFIMTGTALWMLVGGVRMLRMPESTLLQAGGAFRPLAFASVWSCGVSIVAVLALLLTGGPLWSILGILVGETAFALFIWRQAARWREGTALA